MVNTKLTVGIIGILICLTSLNGLATPSGPPNSLTVQRQALLATKGYFFNTKLSKKEKIVILHRSTSKNMHFFCSKVTESVVYDFLLVTSLSGQGATDGVRTVTNTTNARSFLMLVLKFLLYKLPFYVLWFNLK